VRRGILLAWTVGLGLVTWRGIKKTHKPVSPGQYAAASGLYVLLAMVAEYEPAAAVATLMAWGFDLAVLFQVLPQQVAGPKATGTTQQKGTTTAGGRG
jgi:hypothetical protein